MAVLSIFNFSIPYIASFNVAAQQMAYSIIHSEGKFVNSHNADFSTFFLYTFVNAVNLQKQGNEVKCYSQSALFMNAVPNGFSRTTSATMYGILRDSSLTPRKISRTLKRSTGYLG